MRNSMKTGLLVLSLAALPAFAQMAPQEASQTVSQPGKVTRTGTVRVSAVVTGIDKTTRTLTLKGPKGKVLDVVAGDEVRNFDQIKVSDTVDVEYLKSMTVELKKPGTPAAGPTETGFAARAEPGEKPAGIVGHSVVVVATVIDVDPVNKTITFQGPKGNIVVADVKNPDQFKVVKKGDQVDVTYTEAVAISVTPAAKTEPKK